LDWTVAGWQLMVYILTYLLYILVLRGGISWYCLIAFIYFFDKKREGIKEDGMDGCDG
jgi:hypothetical protein